MSAPITDWVNEVLYPELFDNIDTALPEFDFRHKGENWISNSKTKITGDEGSSRGKVYVWSKAPYCLKDYRGDNISIVNYVMQRDGIAFIDAVKKLAEVTRLELPKGDIDEKALKQNAVKASILEDCNSYFTYCLENSPKAKDVKNYLKNARGYTEDDIKAMELGYIPSQEKLHKYLLETKHHSQEDINKAIKLNPQIGETHQLTIPYRSGGKLKGFKFRTIGEHQPKYLNSTGLSRNEGFFNLLSIKGDKDIVIVEGELDSLHASAKGVNNVVASGGSNISTEAIKDAIKRGAKRFTICFDYEEGKELTTQSNILKGIKTIQAEGVNEIFIARLPKLDGPKTDPDKLIKEKGVEVFKKVIDEAISYYTYKLLSILKKYGERETKKGQLTDKDVKDFLNDVVTAANTITEPNDKAIFIERFTSIEEVKSLGITEESIGETVDRLTKIKEQEQQRQEVDKILSYSKKLQDKGETIQALEYLEEKLPNAKLKSKGTTFEKLFITPTEEEIVNTFANMLEPLKSGYTIENKELEIPSGAISVIAAATGHGKTTMLINLALNILENYPKTEAYFFTYEESKEAIISYFLNTYLNTELSRNNRGTIRSYLTTGSTQYIKGNGNKREEKVENFKKKKDTFFSDLLKPGKLNVNYINYNIDILVDAIRYIKKNANPGVIILDYIQLINLPTSKYKTYSRQEEVKVICQKLKDVAVETGLPIIVGAQFNRKVDSKEDISEKKIGEAGDIERIANLILGLWDNNLKTSEQEPEETLFVKVLKNRGGRKGLEETLAYDSNRAKIENNNIHIEDPFK